jgi:hypothetical protein
MAAEYTEVDERVLNQAGSVRCGALRRHPKAHVVLVMRKGTKVERFPNVQKDGIWLRAVSRMGIGFLNPDGVVRGYDVP